MGWGILQLKILRCDRKATTMTDRPVCNAPRKSSQN
jgi:hypothetical protein